MEIKELLKKLPDHPGVYLMKDETGKVIYVGKAISLKRRVKSYFQRDFEESPRVAAMVSRVRDIEWRLADSEDAALLIESNLIKQLRPRYNVVLKDDKSYPYLRLTNEDYPRLEAVRRPYHGRGENFGPFMAGPMRETMKLIHEVFPMRYCEGSLKNKKPCIYYEMKSCLAPCIPGQVSKEDYAKVIGQIKLFLLGKKVGLIKDIENKMWEEAQKENFEGAAKLRDRLDKVRSLIQQQLAARHLKKDQGEMFDRPSQTKGLTDLARACFLPREPSHMEAFDISHLQGSQSVASLVVFKDGVPSKKDYRKFKIKTVQGIDDFASMAEVVGRRYSRLQREGQPMPDLILVDGGKGQLHEAYKALQKLGLQDIPLISLAKREEHIFLTVRPEPVVLPRNSAALHLVQWIRDEAHRFAITFHRALRGKLVSASLLDKLSSIGDKRKQSLLKFFGSVDILKQASLEQIKQVPGFSDKLASLVFEFLQQEKN